MARAKQWVRTTRTARREPPSEVEKQAIVAACETF